MIELLVAALETPPVPEPVDYLMTPSHIAALHHCLQAAEERVEGFSADFYDGEWWVRFHEDELGASISFIPYDPASGMRGGDMTCEFDPATGELTGEVLFGR